MSDDAEAGRSRVERDARGRRASFEEIEVGATLGEMDWVVTLEALNRRDPKVAEFAMRHHIDEAFALIRAYRHQPGTNAAPRRLRP